MIKTDKGYELTHRLWQYGKPHLLKCRKPGVGMVDKDKCHGCLEYAEEGYRKAKGQSFTVCRYDYKQ